MERFGFRTIFGLCAIAALAACGSRTQLTGWGSPGETADGGAGGAGGTGGTTSTSTSTTTTSTTSDGGGGTGGMLMGPCAQLTYATPYSDLDGGLTAHQRFPALTYSRDDLTRVTLASGWQAADQGPDAPIELRHTSFEPWVDFPAGSGFGPTNLADLDGGVSFAAAPSMANKFAMLYRDFNQPPPNGLRFSTGFKPTKGDPPMSSFVADPTATDALFLAYDGDKWLFGGQEQVGNEYETRIGVVDANLAESLLPVACTVVPSSADAVPIAGGFLVGFGANTVPAAGCAAGIPSAPQGPHVGVVKDGNLGELITFGGVDIRDVRMAPRNGGAWIVWIEAGSEDMPASLWIAAFNQDGTLVVEPFGDQTSCQPGSLAVTSFEDFLILSCIVPIPDGWPSPYVWVIDPQGVPRGKTDIQPGGQTKGRLSLIGSPISRSAVLAWSETAGIGDQIRITRVDCLDKN